MKRIIALVLVLLIILCSCTNKIRFSETSSSTTEKNPTSSFIIDSRYKIIYADESTDAAEAARYIRTAIGAVSGEFLSLETDWVRRGEAVKPDDFEILVGSTNRTESADLFASMKRDDWEYRVKEGQIIICGGDAEATLKAAKAFCSDLLGYNGVKPIEKSTIKLVSGASRSYAQAYPITAITLNGRQITDYVLAVPILEAPYLEAAAVFNDLLSENSGLQLSVKVANELKDGQFYIKLGEEDSIHSPYEYTISNDNGVLKFSGDANAIDDAVKRYLQNQLTADSGKIALSLPKEKITDFGGQQNGLVLKNETKQIIADGVEYRLLSYKDSDNKPINAYVLVVEPGKAKVINGTPNGGTVLHNVSATTAEAAKSAEAQGYDVIAGVNADYFNINSDYSPQGACIKNGQVLSISTNHPYFGVTKDGKFVIAEASTLTTDSKNLLEAVGGMQIILKNGAIHKIADNEYTGYTRHPRTSVGYDQEGKLYLLVVDGRQPSISNGASLADLAIIMLKLGATDALNLDGGGSSSFVLKNQNEFKVMNSPSDGRLRKVYNSLLVISN